jgi:predicted O-methyltransferase YrrM
MRRFLKTLVTAKSEKPIEVLLTPLDLRFRSALLSLYRGEPQIGSDGTRHSIDSRTRISPSQGIYLYELCLSVKPKSTLEIGMAYGYSTIYFLASIAQNQTGHHVAIDPYQNSYWHGIGLAHANALAPATRNGSAFQLFEDRSDRIATDFARSKADFDIVFIDGAHRFDDVLVDFYLYSQLCTVGGYIILDDMWMSSVRTVASFVRTNRNDFMEVRTAEPNICVFQKVAEDSRDWDDFHRFSCHRTRAYREGNRGWPRYGYSRHRNAQQGGRPGTNHGTEI